MLWSLPQARYICFLHNQKISPLKLIWHTRDTSGLAPIANMGRVSSFSTGGMALRKFGVGHATTIQQIVQPPLLPIPSKSKFPHLRISSPGSRVIVVISNLGLCCECQNLRELTGLYILHFLLLLETRRMFGTSPQPLWCKPSTIHSWAGK